MLMNVDRFQCFYFLSPLPFNILLIICPTIEGCWFVSSVPQNYYHPQQQQESKDEKTSSANATTQLSISHNRCQYPIDRSTHQSSPEQTPNHNHSVPERKGEKKFKLTSSLASTFPPSTTPPFAALAFSRLSLTLLATSLTPSLFSLPSVVLGPIESSPPVKPVPGVCVLCAPARLYAASIPLTPAVEGMRFRK